MRREKWTIRTFKGEPIVTLIVETEPLREEEKPSAPPPSAKSDGPVEKMTEPQRRYLFRLLAGQGVEGKAAEEHLKDYFKVKSLSEVPREAASHLIDQMVKDKKETEDARA